MLSIVQHGFAMLMHFDHAERGEYTYNYIRTIHMYVLYVHAYGKCSPAGVQKEQSSCCVQSNAACHARVRDGPPSRLLPSVPAKAPRHVFRDGMKQVSILHIFLDQDGLPNLHEATERTDRDCLVR